LLSFDGKFKTFCFTFEQTYRLVLWTFHCIIFITHHRTKYNTVNFRAARRLPSVVYDTDTEYEIRWWNFNRNSW